MILILYPGNYYFEPLVWSWFMYLYMYTGRQTPNLVQPEKTWFMTDVLVDGGLWIIVGMCRLNIIMPVYADALAVNATRASTGVILT